LHAIAISPFRVTRAEEMWLLWHFASMIRLKWRMLVELGDTIQMVADVAGPLMSKRVKTQFSAQLLEAREFDTSEPHALRENAAMHYAAANWFCRLELPNCAEDLWAGPPLAGRRAC
jgi:hypothetical protein